MIEGRVWTFGDNVPTDEIVPSDLVFKPLEEMAEHVLETRNPEFPKSVEEGDVIVAGEHFGQSSGRAIAPKAVQATGVACVVADSFARTFYRNCFEIGLPVLAREGVTDLVDEGDTVSVDLREGQITNTTTGETIECESVDPFLLEMVESGGLIPYKKQGFSADSD
ncbi:3-isopropylmalate dehydratase [Halobellus salinisoli]|uniref:LeuD/DmdB family oxidoreductase small subunit n=1 Tax=Halobellus salinisoli TaxID=3108500 RepID=UPI003008576E